MATSSFVEKIRVNNPKVMMDYVASMISNMLRRIHVLIYMALFVSLMCITGREPVHCASYSDKDTASFPARSGKCGPDAYWRYDTGTVYINGSGKITQPLPLTAYNPDGEETVGAEQVKHIVIGEGITELACPRAFYYAGYVKDIHLPKSLVKITDAGLAGLERVKSITIPAAVSEIGEGVFYMGWHPHLREIIVEDGNPYFVSEKGCLYDRKKTRLIACVPTGTASVLVLPDTVKAISALAFARNRSISEIVLPKNLQKLGGGAFFSCQKLERANLQDTHITEIGEYDGRGLGLYNAERLHAEEEDIPVGSIEESKEYYPDQVYLFGAFEGTKLQELRCPEGVRYISSFSVPDTVRHLYLGAAYEGDIMGGYPEYASYQDFWSIFEKRDTLTKLPVSGLTRDKAAAAGQEAAFFQCGTEKAVRTEWRYAGGISGGKPVHVLENISDLEGSLIPLYKKDMLFLEDLGENLKTIEVSPDNTRYKSIDNLLYSKDGDILYGGACKDMPEEVVIEERVEQIYPYAFSRTDLENPSIQILTFSHDIDTIGMHAFYRSDIWIMTVHGSVGRIGKGAFRESGIWQWKADEGVEVIEESAFRKSYSLEYLYLGDHVRSISDDAFEGTYPFVEYHYPMRHGDWRSVIKTGNLPAVASEEDLHGAGKSLTEHLSDEVIGQNAWNTVKYWQPEDFFAELELVRKEKEAEKKRKEEKQAAWEKDIYYQAKLEEKDCNPIKGSCGAGVVWHKEKETVVVEGEGVITERIMYSGGGKVRHIVIKEGITGIRCAGAFVHLKQARTITLPKSLKTIGDYAFYGMAQVRQLDIPAKVSHIGTGAFYLNDKMKITVAEENPCYYIRKGGLYSGDGKELVYYNPGRDEGVKECVIPEGAEKIDSFAFAHTGISRLVLPSTLKKLLGSPFYDAWIETLDMSRCTSLELEDISGWDEGVAYPAADISRRIIDRREDYLFVPFGQTDCMKIWKILF